MVWVWALEAVKPIILRTVGWEAVVAAAAMLQAKQERGLHNSLEGNWQIGYSLFESKRCFVFTAIALVVQFKTFKKKCFLIWCEELGRGGRRQ
jgi:hypothetical protein